MLKHYPEPAFVNGEEVESAAFNENPTIIRIAETGSFNSHMTRRNISVPAGGPAGLILSEGLTYLNDADEGGRARRAVLPGEPPRARSLNSERPNSRRYGSTWNSPGKKRRKPCTASTGRATPAAPGRTPPPKPLTN